MCSCHTEYDEDTGLDLGLVECDDCLLAEGVCDCSQEERCRFCEMRPFIKPTLADKTLSEKALQKAIDIFKEEYNNWFASKDSGNYYTDSLFSDGSVLDLTTERDQYRLRKVVFVDDQFDYSEIAKWYESWASGDPVHLEPSRWIFPKTLQLVWGMKQ